MKYRLSTVQGDTIYQLSSISRVNADDTFIVNRSADGEHLDYKITYEQLSARILADLSLDYHLSSMAFRDWWEYAKVIHEHNYDKVKFEPTATTGIYKIGTVVIDGQSIDWYIPPMEEQHYDANIPTIGELRFIYGIHTEGTKYVFNGQQVTPVECKTTSGSTVRAFKDPSYDGYWMQPLGQRIQTSTTQKFQDICKIFGNNGRTGNDLSFTLPDYRHFLKMNPGSVKTDATQLQNYQVGLPVHEHPFSYSADQTKIPKTMDVIFSVGMGWANGSTPGNVPHRGPYYDGIGISATRQPDKFTINFSENITGFSTNSTGNNNIEVYPSYVVLPLFMYIGTI